MPSTWTGVYLDGRTATRRAVTVRPMRNGLSFTTQDGMTHTWPYPQIRQTQGFYAGEPVRLECGGELAEVLVIEDHDVLTALHHIAPDQMDHVYDPVTRHLRLKFTILAGGGALAAMAVLYLWGIPLFAGMVTPFVPVSWERTIGKRVIEHFSTASRFCHDPTRFEALEQIVTKLESAAPENPYTITLHVVDLPIMNALAAPGGDVVIFRGLLEKTERPEQLAGVLAHELQHIYQRHTTRALIEHASSSVLLAAMAGDFSGAILYGAEAARTLTTLHYGRAREKEADIKGMDLMINAGLDPLGMVEFFELLGHHRPNAPGALEYLSSHPSTPDRVDSLKQRARSAPSPNVPLLPETDWNDVRNICRIK